MRGRETAARDLFGIPAMRDVFGETAYLGTLVRVEVALARARARVGVVPPDAADAIAARCDPPGSTASGCAGTPGPGRAPCAHCRRDAVAALGEDRIRSLTDPSGHLGSAGAMTRSVVERAQGLSFGSAPDPSAKPPGALRPGRTRGRGRAPSQPSASIMSSARRVLEAGFWPVNRLPSRTLCCW